jgi:hypothetical protein
VPTPSGEHRTIISESSPSAARALIRSHLQSPFAGLMWTFGRRAHSLVVGFVLGNYLYARPFPRGSIAGRIKDSLVMRGRLTVRQGGGCELQLRVQRPSASVVRAAVLAAIAVLLFVSYAVTTDGAFLFGALLLLGMSLAAMFIRRTYQAMESDEWALFGDWLAALEEDLQRGPSQ